MARLPRAAPYLGHKADHSHLSKIGEEKRGARLRASIQERGCKSPLNPPFYKGGKGGFLRVGSAVCHFVYRLLRNFAHWQASLDPRCTTEFPAEPRGVECQLHAALAKAEAVYNS